MNWIEKIKPIDLVVEAPHVQIMDFDNKYTIDDAAALMVQGAPQFFASLKDRKKEELIKGYYKKGYHKRVQTQLPPKDWWPRVKEEFHIFLCTDEKRYEKLREKLQDSANATSVTILSVISAAIGNSLGFEAGAIVGLVAVCLYAVIKFGKEAYCAMSYNK